MSFRTVVITKQSKLSYKNKYLAVKSDLDENYIHLSEIDTIIVDSIAVSISSYLLKELSDNKINIIFCDEKHNPFGELSSFYSSHNTSKKILMQTKWSSKQKDELWSLIVKNKIVNQAMLLNKIKSNNYDLVMSYLSEVRNGDKTNREALAAKVYFSELFGKTFDRSKADSVNAGLNYGYTILCSTFNRFVTIHGYSTCIGFHHCNRQNKFNLSSDLMEPFRPFVDEMVFGNKTRELDNEYKAELIGLLYNECTYDGNRMELLNAIELYSLSVFDSLATGRTIGEVGFC